MRELLGLTAAVLAICLAVGGLPSGGFWWDLLAALGYCAFALVAFMGWDSESPARNPRLRQHRNLAVLATAVALSHALGYLLIDPIIIEHLLPAAPTFMLAGLLALLLIVGITWSSLPVPRQRAYSGFGAFRSWHRGLYLGLLALTGWHALGTDFSLSRPWQIVLLAGLLGGAPLAAYLARRLNRTPPLTRGPGDEAAADLHPALSGIVMVALALAFAGLKLLACDVC